MFINLEQLNRTFIALKVKMKTTKTSANKHLLKLLSNETH
ncbi:MAG: hypothetical protein ACJASQ_001245 [Crocinitomicaceae bacterium]|jgi:hypothetical protein